MNLLLTSFGLLVAVLISCGKPPAPPSPIPPDPVPTPVLVMDFVVVGRTVKIEGKLKPSAKATAEEAKVHFATAAALIDQG